MNEVLKINYETEQPTVSARELHEALGVASRFSRWFDSNKELFVEGEDYNNPIDIAQGSKPLVAPPGESELVIATSDFATMPEVMVSIREAYI